MDTLVDSLFRPRSAVAKAARFWHRVDFTSECWLWTGWKDKDGYGHANLAGPGQLAHRVAWKLVNGDPGDLYVLHACDMPPCVRPEHLFLGTQLQNMQDMVRKGRYGQRLVHRGAANPSSKLNDAAILLIRRRWESGEQGKSLAEEFGVSRAAISRIVHGQKWTHV